MRMIIACVRISLLAGAALLADVTAARAQEVHVLSSGGVAAPYLELVAPFEKRHSITVVTRATSTGIGQDSIPSRLRRRETADVVILPDAAIRDLLEAGLVVADSRVELARSGIGMAVRAGAPKPDISTVEGLRRALLQAQSVAYSAQVSGIYLSTELFPRLGIAEQMKPKSKVIEIERVGAVVARGDAEIGFQQISELLPIKGIDYAGPLPADVQRITLFSAAVTTWARNPSGAHALIAFLASPDAARVMTKYGLEPVKPR